MQPQTLQVVPTTSSNLRHCSSLVSDSLFGTVSIAGRNLSIVSG